MKTARIALFLGVLISSLVLGRASLHAQPVSAQVSVDGNDKPWNRGVPLATREAAKKLFLEGNRLFDIPVYIRAAEKYIAALAMWKHPAFYFNLGLARLNLGQDVEARDSLEQALKHGPEPLGAERFREAQEQLQDLERKLGRLRITCPTAGAEITLDGIPLFTGPGSYEGWVKAIAHEVTAKKADYVSQSKRVTVLPGKFEVMALPLSRLVEERPWSTWKPWVVVAGGIAIAAAGGVVHGISARDFRGYDSGFSKLTCAKTGCMDQDIDDMNPLLTPLLNRARLEQRIAVSGYAVGGSLIAAGTVLVYLNRPRLIEQGVTNSPVTGVAIIPTISVDVFGILVNINY